MNTSPVDALSALATLVAHLDENADTVVEQSKLLPDESPILDILTYINGVCRYHVDAQDESERQELIRWLCANDPNGIYADEDCDCEGIARLTVESASELKREQIERS